MADDPVVQMASDPDFSKMPLDEQRKALTAHDANFNSLGDDDLTSFVQAHQKPASPTFTGPAKTISPSPKPFTMPWLKSKALAAGGALSETLPGAGATAGGIAGAQGGASAGPLGAILGAIGGAGLGGMGGNAAKQIAQRAMGFESPSTPQEAASQITKEGLTQGAIQGATEGLPFLAGPLKRAAVSQYERALAPTTKINKAITQKIAPEMIQRGEYGSLGSLEKRAGQQAEQLKPQLDAAYQAMPVSSTASSGPQIIQSLEALKGKYTVQGMPANPTAVNAISGVQDIVKQYGDDIAPDSLRKIKQIFDDPVAQQGGYAGADLASKYTLKAQKAASNSIRNIVGQASPDVAALSKEVTFWLNVQRVTQQSGLRRTGQEGLVRTLSVPFLSGIGAAAGHSVGSTAEGAAAGALTTAATLVVRSPAWRTLSAVVKDRFADALARGDVGAVSALASRIGVAGLRQTGQQNPQASQRLPWQQQ